MAKRQINYELLEKVKMRLKRMRHPEHFDMDNWVEDTSCGTTMCIAGYGLMLGCGMKPETLYRKMEDDSPFDVEAEARKVFGLSPQQGDRLFFTNWWPNSLAFEYDTADGPAERRDIAVKRIEHFIQTQGRE